MNAEASDFWNRALQALRTAKALVSLDADAAASRAYYAAFYAVSALFALQGKTFSKHTGVEAAVHRDLVKAGCWSEDLGQDYSFLLGLRATGDYGGGLHVSSKEAAEALAHLHGEAGRLVLFSCTAKELTDAVSVCYVFGALGNSLCSAKIGSHPQDNT